MPVKTRGWVWMSLAGMLAACAPPAAPGRVAPARVREAERWAHQAVQQERAITTDSLEPRSVAVAPLQVHTTDTTLAPLGFGLAAMLMTDLSQVRSTQLKVVDRLRIDALLRELNLARSGDVDTSTAPRVGRVMRAQRLVVGALNQRPAGQLAVDANIADVATGQVRSAVSTPASADDIVRAEKDLAFKILAELGVNLTPREQAQIAQNATRNVAALLAYSRGVRYEVEGRYDAAATEYRNAMRLDPSFGAAGSRLRDVQPGAATAMQGSPVKVAASLVTDQVNTLPVAPTGGAQQPAGASESRVVAPRTVTVGIQFIVP